MQNRRNSSPKRVSKTSQYRGVIFSSGKYTATLGHNNKHYYLGRYTSELDAAKAYDEVARKVHKEFAVLNFPE